MARLCGTSTSPEPDRGTTAVQPTAAGSECVLLLLLLLASLVLLLAVAAGDVARGVPEWHAMGGVTTTHGRRRGTGMGGRRR